MALFSLKFKVLSFVLAVLYLLTHVFVKCPLTSAYKPDGLGSNDLICSYTHKYYKLAEPHIGPFVEAADAKVFTPLGEHYAKSPIKPYVDYGYHQTANKYSIVSDKVYEVTKQGADKYFGLVREKSIETWYKVAAKTEEVVSISSIYLKAKAETLKDLIKTKSIHFAVLTKEVVLTKVVPQTVKFFLYVKTKSLVYTTKLRIALHLRYNLYVHPQLSKLYYKLKLDALEPYFEAFQKSWFYENTSRLIVLLVDSLNYLYAKSYEYILAFKQDSVIRKTTEEYWRTEHKKQFLKDEFNKLMNAKFKIPSYEDVEFFKKLSKQAAETEKGDDVSETTSVVEPTLTKYNKLLKGIKVDALSDFETQVAKIDSEISSKIQEDLKPQLQELSKLANSNYEDIHVLIHDVNHSTDKKVTRQDMRDILAKASSNLGERADAIVAEFKKYEEEYSDKVLKARTTILETLEEFSESTLTAYSTEIVQKGDDWKEWKNYNELKQDLIQTRDLLLNSTPKLEKVNKLMNELNRTLSILVNDGKSYLAILRAKANLEFQSREKAEREAEQEITSTIVLYDTVVLDEQDHPVSTIHAQEPEQSEQPEEAQTLII
ncbi:hypothetical protein OGAPHI_005306 [Ogataea philodendri]|uniref:Outer spore wall assembly protein SHE10 n=1 Tax=Ogataea philodendri TaxID=1378263 RepID=A0A9P8T269_9ASCO|nr:uncharacterized protein OGAPHI_005306 [Ogataea philodendri]KAH3663316.1 hypothetical protein OGAPHI_005306 [Ogataea philodendri]